MAEMSRHTYWGSPYVLCLFSMTVLDAIPLNQGLKMPTSPDLLNLTCQHNSRGAYKLPSGSHCSSEYLFLILAFIAHHSMLTDPHRSFIQTLSLGHHSLEKPTTHPDIHRSGFVSITEIAWRSQNSVSSAPHSLQCPWRSRLCGFLNSKSRHNLNTKQRSKRSHLSCWDWQHMGGAKEKAVEGTMLWQCCATLGMPSAPAVSLESGLCGFFNPNPGCNTNPKQSIKSSLLWGSAAKGNTACHSVASSTPFSLAPLPRKCLLLMPQLGVRLLLGLGLGKTQSLQLQGCCNYKRHAKGTATTLLPPQLEPWHHPRPGNLSLTNASFYLLRAQHNTFSTVLCCTVSG